MQEKVTESEERMYTREEALARINEYRGDRKPIKLGSLSAYTNELGLKLQHEIRYSKLGNKAHEMPHVVSLYTEEQLQLLLQAQQPKPKPVKAVVVATPRGVEYEIQVLRDKYRDLGTEMENLRARIRRMEDQWKAAGF